MFVYIVYLVGEASHFLLRRLTHFLYGCGYHYNRIDGASLDAGTDDAKDDSVAHSVEYYD